MKLNSYFPAWATTGGIFTALMSATSGRTFPWSTDSSVTAAVLDIDYHGLYSGNKTVSPLVKNLAVNDSLTAAAIEQICKVIYQRNIKNWGKLWSAVFAEYNPIENYAMTETETGGYTDTRTPTNWKITETQQNKTSDSSVYGFNSSTPVGDSRTVDTGSTETAYSGTDETEHDIDRTLERSGNIGVTTSQQMIEAEIELRKTNFFELVYMDVDKILCTNIYESEE